MHLPLSAQICANREKLFWPKSVRLLPTWLWSRNHAIGWRNARAKKLGYKAHRHCTAGIPIYDHHTLRMANLWPWEAVQMTFDEVLNRIERNV